MNKKRTTVAALAALGLVAGTAAATGTASAGGETVELTFQSLSDLEPTIAATEAIVDAWNEANPNIQVDLTQGSWDNVHDQLVTQFAGGTAPDLIHDESADIMGFAEQGYLADITEYLSEDVKAAVSDEIWQTVTSSDGAIVAVPTLLQSYVVFANLAAFEAAGVELPTGETLTWDDFAALSSSLTGDDGYGLGWGLGSPAATVMSLSLGFGGDFFTLDGDDVTFEVGEAELEVPRRIHEMAYTDQSIDPASLTQSGTDSLQGFYGGDYAMIVGGSFLSRSIVDTGPEDFEFAVLPPLAGTEGAFQSANPQTISVSADSEHPDEAAQFLNFFMEASNLASVAQGDVLIPTSSAARDAVAEATAGENGWEGMLASAEGLVPAPFQSVADYTRWKDQYLQPALQEFLASDSGDLDDLASQLTDGWDQAGG